MLTDDIMKNYEFTSLKFYTDNDFKKLVFVDEQTEILLQNLVYIFPIYFNEKKKEKKKIMISHIFLCKKKKKNIV